MVVGEGGSATIGVFVAPKGATKGGDFYLGLRFSFEPPLGGSNERKFAETLPKLGEVWFSPPLGGENHLLIF